MFIPLSVVSLCVSIVVVGVSFLLLALLSENPKKITVVWTILFFGGILLFFCLLHMGTCRNYYERRLTLIFYNEIDEKKICKWKYLPSL